MPRAISKTDIIFGLIRVGVEDEVFAWIDRSAKQLIVGDRELSLTTLAGAGYSPRCHGARSFEHWRVE